MKVSAVVFVFWPEEKDYIETCLKTLSWVDEIVVIDNGASDKTLSICRKYTGKIYATESKSFAQHHNLGKEKASGEWILYIDADERISRNLQQEIQKVLAYPKFDAYQLRRINYFLGKEVQFGDRFPDYVTRLFKKDKLAGWEGEVHESSNVVGVVGKLTEPMYHLTHRNIYLMMDKTKNFSEHEAKLRQAASHPRITGWRLLRVFLTELYTRLLRYQGVRGGTEGWIDGIFQAFSLFIAYVRLWELQRKPTLKETYKNLDREILSGSI